MKLIKKSIGFYKINMLEWEHSKGDENESNANDIKTPAKEQGYNFYGSDI